MSAQESKKLIAIVDPLNNKRVMAHCFRKKGCEVVAEANLADMLRQCTRSPDVVIAREPYDSDKPEIYGWVEQARESYQGAIIIAIGMHEAQADKCKEWGANEFHTDSDLLRFRILLTMCVESIWDKKR